MALSISPLYLHWGLIDFNVTVTTASGSNTLIVDRIISIRVGESLPFVFSRGDLTTDGWVCNITVKKVPGDTSVISRTIELSSGVWAGFLTSTETTTLSNGTYRLTGVLTNSATDEEEQQRGRFNISDSWA